MTEHKDWVKRTFDGASPGYGEKGCSFFAYFGERLVEFTSPSHGARILDVATGKGAVLVPAAKRVGPQGSAIGIDLSPKMLEQAAKKVPFPWIELREMDAERLEFPESTFDAVFCAFALFFFPNPTQALSECRRVLKPKGSLAVSIFSKQAHLDLWISERIKEYGVTAKLGTTTENRIPALLKQLSEVGFTRVETLEESKVFWHENGEEWWSSLWTHGIRSRLEKLAPDDLAALKREALLQAGSGKVAEERHVFYAVAKL